MEEKEEDIVMTEEKEEDIPPHGLSKRLFSLYNKAKESGVTERALDRFFVPFGPYADVVQAQRRKKGTERMKEKDKVTAKIKPVQEVVKYVAVLRFLRFVSSSLVLCWHY